MHIFDFTTFIVGYRPGISFENMLGQLPKNIINRIEEHNKIELFQLDSVDISSSYIRENIEKSYEFLPEEVYVYIKQNKLYR